MKTTIKNTITSKLGLATALTALLMGTQVFAQTVVPVTKTNTSIGGGQFSIKQNATFNPSVNSQLTFEKLDEVTAQTLTTSDLVEINITFLYDIDTLGLTLTNNGDTNYTGGTGQFQTIETKFTTPPANALFNFGAGTNEGGGDVEGADFNSFLTWNLGPGSVDIAADGGTDSLTTPIDVDVTRNLTAAVDNFNDAWDDYAGSGTFDFLIDVENTISANVGFPGDVTASQIISGQSFFVEVEYIVIPEVGTLAMAAIALGSFGGIALLRRRKRA